VLHTYVVLTKPIEWVESIDFGDPKAAQARVAAELAGWSPELVALLTDGDTSPVPRPIHRLPAEHRWVRVPGVTLVGDAAHLNPPDGEGANLAMYDGSELGEAIAAHPEDLERALIKYEEAMFARAEKAAPEAEETFALCFGERAPYGLLEMLSGA